MNLSALLRNAAQKLFYRTRHEAQFSDQQRAAQAVAQEKAAEAEQHETFKDARPLHHGNKRTRGGGTARCRCASKALIPVWCPRHRAYVLNGAADRELTHK